jgi:hypothetical protein
MKPQLKIAVVMMLLGIALTFAFGADKAPTTSPAARFDTPMGTFRAHQDAVARGDAKLFRECYGTDKRDESAAITSIGESFAAMSALKNACVDKFGAEQAKRIGLGLTTNIPDDAYEEISGDSATIHNVGGAKPQELRRMNGEWKLTYDSLVSNNFRDLPRLAPDVLAQLFQISRQMYESLSSDVSAGKFASAAEVNTELASRRQTMGEQMHELITKSKLGAAKP